MRRGQLLVGQQTGDLYWIPGRERRQVRDKWRRVQGTIEKLPTGEIVIRDKSRRRIGTLEELPR